VSFFFFALSAERDSIKHKNYKGFRRKITSARRVFENFPLNAADPYAASSVRRL
jgi:hypothetical protein